MTLQDIKNDLIAHGGNLPGIYKIIRKSDSKVYIGQTEKPIADRIEQHINNKHINHGSDNIDKAIKVEGIDAFKYEVELFLPHADTDQLWDLESQYIKKYNSYLNGFNLTKGNHVGKSTKNTASYILHTVKVDLFKKLVKQFNLNFINKTVLLINSFDHYVKAHLDFEDCTVTQITSSDFVEYKNGNLIVNSKEYGKYIMEELNKLKGKHFDIIISNPPYSGIGADITDYIRKEISYDEFVNLLPANDYMRNATHDLFKYTDLANMIAINDGFDDANVTTHATRIYKEPCMYITEAAFEIENYLDKSLKKYFYANRNKKHYAIDSARRPNFNTISKEDNTNTILIGIRDMNHHHLSYDKKCDTYLWNVEKSINIDKLKSNIGLTGSKNNQASHYFITFNTAAEKENFAKFMYSADGFKFLSKIFTALNTDSMVALGKFLPKVDWTRSWTVEEILRDYDYTAEEIAEVVADLDNFKGMDN